MGSEQLRGLGRVFRRTRRDPKNPKGRIQSPIWWVQYYHRGKQIRKSTGETRHSKAVLFLKGELAAAGSGPFGAGQAKGLAFRQRAENLISDFTSDRSLVDEFLSAIEPFAGRIEQL
jgi:hypothetical protein